jgi:hypothetical protein
MAMVLPSINAASTKNGLHAIQGLIIFLAWVLTIAVFTKGNGVDGRSGWYFGMVRLVLISSSLVGDERLTTIL